MQRIEPLSPIEIERIRISDDRQVIAVNIKPGSLPPYRYRGISYRRVGNTTGSMSSEDSYGMVIG